MAWKNPILTALRRRYLSSTAAPSDPAYAPLLDTAALRALYERALSGAVRSAAAREVAYPQLGDARAVQRGFGLDYEESRPYQMGDEPRFMNWRLTARTGEPHIKVFREEHRPGVFILVDRRVAMRFGTRVRLKATQAARAAALIAFAGGRGNLTLGGVLLQQRPVWLTEIAGESGAFALAEAAARPCPPLASTAVEPALGTQLRLLHATLPRGTAIYLISDFPDLDARLSPALLQLAAEHQVCAIHIVDPAELRLPPAGPLHLQPRYGDRGRVVDTSDPATAQAYATAAADYLSARQEIFLAADIPYVRLTTDLDAIERVIPLP